MATLNLKDPSDDASGLERLRDRLYAPKAPEAFPAPELRAPMNAAPAADAPWQETSPPVVIKKARISPAALFLLGAAIFFAIAIAVAAFFLIFGGFNVSTDRVTITVDGPTGLNSGDTASLLVTVKNNNPVTITATQLSVDFPDTARSPLDPTRPAHPFSDTLGDIAPGASVTRTVPVVLFGAENSKIPLPLRLEYKTQNSNAVFVKQASQEVTITSSPISLTVQALSQVSSGQPFTISVTVRSNAATDLQNVALLPQYPFGFVATKATNGSTSPLIDVGTLAPGASKTITITGTLSGENSDSRVFHFTAGTRTDADAIALANTYTTSDAAVTLTKPFLATTLSIQKDTSEAPVIQAGVPAQGLISWVNTLSSQVLDGQISIKLAGSALDPGSVSASGGFYRSTDSTILYSKDTSAGLARLEQGDSGAGAFTFSTKTGTAFTSLRNPTITATVSVAGRRVGESNVPEAISSTVTRTIKVGTDLDLTAVAVRTTGPFKNTGPWPPEPDKETTYTIVLTLRNDVNAVASTLVTGTLPSYVRYVGAVSPNDSTLTYNEHTRMVTWNAGDIAAGTGYGAASRQVAFQVALLPSSSQRGTSPILMNTPQLTAVDRFTQHQIAGSKDGITTQTNTDPAYQSNFGEVLK